LRGALMPEVINAGVRIHYSVQGDGPPLLLHHGSGSNGAAWLKLGYAKPLRERYRLVLIDARGHGQSDKPHDRASHTLALRVGDVIAVLDALDIPEVHFFGYSMGGWIGFGMAELAPKRLRSLVIGGAHPFADPFVSDVELAEARDAEGFIRAMESVLGERVSDDTRRFLLRNDAPAVIASLKERTPLDRVLAQIDVPALLFAGTADRRHDLVEQAAARIRRATFVSLPGCNHLQTLANAEQVLPHLQRFLQVASAPE
jgi:pimeloyl-ACP methyl ester carboxylesterase